jgi:hypothetical protein
MVRHDAAQKGGGLMIVGEHGADLHLLGLGRGIEAAVNKTH